MQMYDKEFMEYVINRLVPMPLILEQVDGVKRNPSRKCLCPFHSNFDTPAAKMYKNEDGWYLFCFSEQRQYRPADVFERKLIDKRLDQVFYKLWEQLSPERQNMLIEEKGVVIDRLPQKWKDAKEKLDLFKLGKTDFRTHLIMVANALD